MGIGIQIQTIILRSSFWTITLTAVIIGTVTFVSWYREQKTVDRTV